MSNSNQQQRKAAQSTAPAGYYQLEKFDPSSYVTTTSSAGAVQYVQAQRQTLLLPSASLASEKSRQVLLQHVQMQQQQQQQQQPHIIVQAPKQQLVQTQQQPQTQAKSRNRKKKAKKMKKILKKETSPVTGQEILIAMEVTDESGNDSTASIQEGPEDVDMFVSHQPPRQELVMSQMMSFEGFSPDKPAPFSIEALKLPPPNTNCYHEPATPKGETKFVMIKEAPVYKTINQNYFSTNTSVKENVIHYNHVKDVYITLNRNHWHTQRVIVKDTNYHHYLINNIIKIKDIHHQKIETTNGESKNISDYKQVNHIEQPVCQETVDEIVKAANLEITKVEVNHQEQQEQSGYVQQEQSGRMEYHYSPLQPCGGCPEALLQQIQQQQLQQQQ